MRETRPRLGKAEAVCVVGWSGARKRPATASFAGLDPKPTDPAPGAQHPEPGADRAQHPAPSTQHPEPFERDPAPSSWSSWRETGSAADRHTRRSAQDPTFERRRADPKRPKTPLSENTPLPGKTCFLDNGIAWTRNRGPGAQNHAPRTPN